MKGTRKGGLRGALTVGVAGTLAAIALIGPVGAVKESKEASKSFVKKQVAGVASSVSTLQSQLGASSASADGPTPLGDAQTTLASVSLPAGHYAVFAKTSLRIVDLEPNVICELKIGGTVRDTALTEVIAGSNDDSTVALQAVDTLAASGSAELTCNDEGGAGGGNAQARFSKVTAIEIP